MTDITIQSPPQARYRIDPQRRAWGILLLAFAAFCTVCVTSVVGMSYFLFQSTLPLEAVAQMGRGTASLSGQAIQPGQAKVVTFNDVLSTQDLVSQATIFFRDSQQGEEKLVAAVTLRSGSALELERGLRPRFPWSSIPYTIDVQNVVGDVDIFIPRDLGRDFSLQLLTVKGDRVTLTGSGQYQVRVSDTQLTVINREGTAVIFPQDGEGRAIPANSQGVVTYDAAGPVVSIGETYANLLSNSTFQDLFTSSDNAASPTLQNWACHESSNQPSGSYLAERVDGRWLLRFLRNDGASNNGQIGCISYLGSNGYDVSTLNYLAIRASLKIDYQSLGTCGVDASECPLMLKINYINQQGEPQWWIHGFFQYIDPNANYPLQCNTCSQEHDVVNQQSWYLYDSGNLFNLIPSNQRPQSIISVYFYASGHQFDVSVGEMALLAG